MPNNIIMVVDDESTFILRFRLILQKIGVDVQHFIPSMDSDQFFSQFERDKNPLVLLDLNIKGSKLNGVELLKELREKHNGHLTIAAISTTSRKVEIEKMRENGANAYIIKSGVLTKFSERMQEFKKYYIDSDTKEFMVFGEEDIV